MIAAMPLTAVPAVAQRPASASETRVGDAQIAPLLSSRWRAVRRHRAHLEIEGRNVAGATSTVTASARFRARRGSQAVWCLRRVYSYRPVAGQPAGAMTVAMSVRHRDGSRGSTESRTWRYSGEPVHLGAYSGFVFGSMLTDKPVRPGDMVTARVKLVLDGALPDLSESIVVTAC